MKKCYKCKEDKPLLEFSKDKQKIDGLKSRCKKCISLVAKESRRGWTEEQKEKERAYNRQPERKAAQAVLVRNWALRNKDKVRAGNNRYRHTEKGIKKRNEYRQSDDYKIISKRYAEGNKVKILAQKKARRAVQKGLLTKTGCEVCGSSEVHGHHPNYKEPLVVMWLCQTHHCEWHRLNGPGLNGE